MDFVGKLFKVYERYAKENPFLFEFLQHCKFLPDQRQTELMRMEIRDFNIYIYYQPEKWNELSVEDLGIQIEHELLHLILKHSVRGEFTNRNQFHTACDMIIYHAIPRVRENYAHILESKNKHFLHRAPLLPIMFENDSFCEVFGHQHVIDRLTAEKLYGFLDLVKGNWQPDCESVDEIDFAISADEKVAIAEICKQIINKIGPDRLYGLEHGFQKMVVKLTQPAKRNYREVVRQFVGKLKQDTKKSWSRVSRRYPNQVAGKSKDLLPTLCVVIDTSGSMSNPRILTEISRELMALKKSVKGIHVVAGDTQLTFAKRFKHSLEVEDIEFKGFGGTNLQFGWDYAFEHKCDGVICYTDGAIGGLEDRGLKSFFVLTDIMPDRADTKFRGHPAAYMEIKEW